MKNSPDFWKIDLGIVIENSVRYLLFAGVAWLLGYVLFKRPWAHKKINPAVPPGSDVWREVRNSAVTLLIFGLVGASTIWCGFKGYNRMYLDRGEHSRGWFFFSIVFAIFLHDMYFYWTHRLMHHPKLFRFFHRTHHESTNPTPWAAYSFAPAEAVVQAGIFPLTMAVIPMHPYAFYLFMLWQLAFNVMGHTGYEFHPKWFLNSWLGKFMNTPTNHVMHHESFRSNYGLYFNIWDRMMGTNHEKYEERFHEVASRKKSDVSISSRPEEVSRA